MNVVFSCGTLAIAKQLFNPANFTPRDAAAQEASKTLPSWFQGQYKQRRVGQVSAIGCDCGREGGGWRVGGRGDAAAQEASKTLPNWFQGQYKQRRVGQVSVCGGRPQGQGRSKSRGEGM